MFICPVCKNKLMYNKLQNRWECTECNWNAPFINPVVEKQDMELDEARDILSEKEELCEQN